MSVCYYPAHQKIKSLDCKLERFRIINEINFTYYLDKTVFDKIMHRILIDFCDSSVLGYDKNSDKYWCKKYNKLSCNLHVEIFVICKGYDYTDIIINPLIGNNEDINAFIYDFNESVQMYNTSNFIRDILCGR